MYTVGICVRSSWNLVCLLVYVAKTEVNLIMKLIYHVVLKCLIGNEAMKGVHLDDENEGVFVLQT